MIRDSRSDVMWFTANLIFKNLKEDGSSDLCEERIILVNAIDEREALNQAKSLGFKEEHSYVLENGTSLKWVFDNVERICEIEGDEVNHGAELFSRFLTVEDLAMLQKPIE